MNKEKQKQLQKKALTDALRKKISETELPDIIVLEKWATITDPFQFFDSHLNAIERASEMNVPLYSERLKKALQIVGIDINEVANSIKK